MKYILSLHPLIQLVGIVLAYYAGYHGLQRARSLHFDQQVTFHRQKHVIAGAAALIVLLGGLFGGFVITDLAFPEHKGIGPHGIVALVLLPLLAIGIGSGYFLYKSPKKQKILAAIHGVNNLVILLLILFQIYSGWFIFRKVILRE